MSRYLARLAKLEAAIPLPTAPIEVRPLIDMAASIARIKAEAAFLETATPLERVVFYRGLVAKREAQLAEASKPDDRSILKSFNTVKLRIWPSFIEDAREDLRQAELDLVREAGFKDLDQPGAREHLHREIYTAFAA